MKVRQRVHRHHRRTTSKLKTLKQILREAARDLRGISTYWFHIVSEIALFISLLIWLGGELWNRYHAAILELWNKYHTTVLI
jgi:hypothetical protein